jgi:hypothetical protein
MTLAGQPINLGVPVHRLCMPALANTVAPPGMSGTATTKRE